LRGASELTQCVACAKGVREMVAFLGIERQTGMSQLEAAQQHFAQALKRLENALARRLTQLPSGADADVQRAFAEITAERNDLARDVSVLRSECDRLSAALSDMQRDHDSLREVTGQVARRIDGSIAEIDRLLEG
jgi:predicted  nucleic acid-binding Zn-ribbon protein